MSRPTSLPESVRRVRAPQPRMQPASPRPSTGDRGGAPRLLDHPPLEHDRSGEPLEHRPEQRLREPLRRRAVDDPRMHELDIVPPPPERCTTRRHDVSCPVGRHTPRQADHHDGCVRRRHHRDRCLIGGAAPTSAMADERPERHPAATRQSERDRLGRVHQPAGRPAAAARLVGSGLTGGLVHAERTDDPGRM